jgi:hypothetical protein
MKKGKALALRHWAKLSSSQRKAAKDGLASYLQTREAKSGYFKHGSTYLGERVWVDYEQAPKDAAAQTHEDERRKVMAVALDLDEGQPNRIRGFGWNTFDDVKRAAAGLW